MVSDKLTTLELEDKICGSSTIVGPSPSQRAACTSHIGISGKLMRNAEAQTLHLLNQISL